VAKELLQFGIDECQPCALEIATSKPYESMYDEDARVMMVIQLSEINTKKDGALA